MSEVRPALVGDEKEFLDAYLHCMLWSSTDNADDSGGEPLDANYDVDDIAPESLSAAEEDCRLFIAANREHLDEVTETEGYTWARAGHDFWLTRNGHGAGFWDRGLGRRGDLLSDASRSYGSRDAYVGDDGKVYLQ